MYCACMYNNNMSVFQMIVVEIIFLTMNHSVHHVQVVAFIYGHPGLLSQESKVWIPLGWLVEWVLKTDVLKHVCSW